MSTSAASLRILGDDLKPQEITNLLGAVPSRSHLKGEKGKHIVGLKVDGVRVARSGLWILNAPDQSPENFSIQISMILDQLTDDQKV